MANCIKCGRELLPTGEMFGGHQILACPKCADLETKEEIKAYAKFMRRIDKKGDDAVKLMELVGKGHVVTSLKGIKNKFKYYVLGYALIKELGSFE